jgi:hypothetical protein
MSPETIESLIAKRDALESLLDGFGVWVIVFGIFVVVGVGGETIYGVRTWWNNRRLHVVERSIDELRQTEIATLSASGEAIKLEMKGADARIAEAQRGAAEAQRNLALAEQHSAEANVKAEGFRLDIAKANESVAQARAQVASAMAEAAKANLELARLKTPRTLSKEQQARITLKISPFPGTPFDLFVNTDSDSTTLMNLIDDAIRAAGWQFKQAGIITFGNKAGIIADSGVSIHVAAEVRSTLEAPALALGNALIAEGIPVAVFADTKEAENGKDRNTIHVMIGSKPLN